ncbi:hypothetical protein Csa_019359 [Cucumis sativus]|uniref:Uncharacterized protein n=1 Tax=Cucumis sativus TaxID=3659 RepID=A0A0A0LG19_CUCSA|nr:hypothetical protein Csa_019359 [Cucumis sativus]
MKEGRSRQQVQNHETIGQESWCRCLQPLYDWSFPLHIYIYISTGPIINFIVDEYFKGIPNTAQLTF